MTEGFVLPGIPLPVFWAFLAAGVIVQGISKSGFAGGAGILSLPLMMLVMPVDRVAAVLLPILILCDMNAIYHHRTNQDWPAIRRLYGPAVWGILLGALVWWFVGQEGVNYFENALKRFVGAIAIVFALYIIFRDRAVRLLAGRTPGRAAAWSAGLAAGFTSTLAHAAGPIVGLYMYAQHLDKSRFVGTVAWTFTLINLTKLPFYVLVGLMDSGVLLYAVVLLPCIPLGSWAGHWLHLRVPERRFNQIILVLTVLAAIQLLSGINVVYVIAQRFA